jgi:hypothetical protein
MNHLLLLLKRRRRSSASARADGGDGLLDILSNTVGVMALIAAMTGVTATGGSLTLQAPMAKQTSKQVVLLHVNRDGIWNLQPAADRMVELDRQRLFEVNRCQQLLAPEQMACQAALDTWERVEQLGSVSMTINHRNGSLRLSGPPTAAAAELKQPGGWLDRTMAELGKQGKAVFLVLETDGFEVYRALKSKALEHGVSLGWEPWYKGDPIYFWGNTGRSFTVQ